MKLNPTLRCPCNGEHREEIFTYRSAPPGETDFGIPEQTYERAYDCCRVCAHWFGRHDLDLDSLYADAYLDQTYGGVEGMTVRLGTILSLPPEESDNAQRTERVAAFANERDTPQNTSAVDDGPRLLDVGAGIGVFPAAMKVRGWRVTAIEPDVRTVEHLRENVGVRAYAIDLLEASSSELGRFDAISFNKVLEHVEDPIELLAHARSFLATDGFCYLEVPDVVAANESPYREEFFIEHHHIFSPRSVCDLIERSGLHLERLERIVEPSGKFTIFAFGTIAMSPGA